MDRKIAYSLICVLNLLLVLLAGCSAWPTRFERIDGDTPRVLDFVYQNKADASLCEGAPGDTMILTAYFAGEEVETIDWKVSYNVLTSYLGSDTSVAQRDFDPPPVVLSPDTTGFSSETQISSIEFVVPDSIMYYANAGILSQFGDMNGMDATWLFGMLESIRSTPPDSLVNNPLIQQFLPLLQDSAALLLSGLSVQMRILATLNGIYEVRSDLTIRYNRVLEWLNSNSTTGEDIVYVNHNPEINFVGIYKVLDPGAGVVGKRMGPRDTTFSLYRSGDIDPEIMGGAVVSTDTIVIDTGYAYFMAVDTGVYLGNDTRDYYVEIVNEEGVFRLGTPSPEIYRAQWFCKHVAREKVGVAAEDLMAFGNTQGQATPMYPPLDTAITQITVWVQVYDEAFGAGIRPDGSALRESKIYFKYTPAYKRYAYTEAASFGR